MEVIFKNLSKEERALLNELGKEVDKLHQLSSNGHSPSKERLDKVESLLKVIWKKEEKKDEKLVEHQV